MFLHRQRIIGAALHRRIIGDDDAFAARDPADTGNDASGGNGFVIDLVSRKLRKFEERTAGIEKRLDAITRQQFAAGKMPLASLVAAAFRDFSTCPLKSSTRPDMKAALAVKAGSRFRLEVSFIAFLTRCP